MITLHTKDLHVNLHIQNVLHINEFWLNKHNQDKTMTGQILHLLEIILNKIILYVFFWVFPPRLIVVRRHFGTLYQFHLHRLDILHIQPMKMEHIECSETSAYNNQTPGKYPKEYIQQVILVINQLNAKNLVL